MKQAFLFFISIIVLNVASAAHAAPAPESFADLSEKLLPSVVNISSTQKVQQQDVEQMPDFPEFPEGSPFQDFFEQFMDRRNTPFNAPPPASLGSGFVIDAQKGYIITNNHVISDADEIRVIFQDNENVEATVIGRDEKTDIAVLQVKTKQPLTAVSFGDSDEMRVGDWVLAIGNPFGLGGTVTAGIISAQNRNIHAGPYDDFLQTDASINKGNSGGPMFNLKGEVIGVNTAIFSPTGSSVGIGFAVPSALVKPVVDQLIQYGKTRRGWLGVRIQTVTPEIAESLELPKTMGAMVASVTKDGPAEKANIKMGDIILSFDGKEISEMRDLPRIVAETEINKAVEIIVWRDGKKQKTRVKIAELEEAEEAGLLEQNPEISSSTASKPVDIETVGLSVVDDADKVIISDVTQMGEALEKGLNIGDVIREINQKKVKSAKDVKAKIEKAKDAGKSSVLLLVDPQGRGEARFVALKLK